MKNVGFMLFLTFWFVSLAGSHTVLAQATPEEQLQASAEKTDEIASDLRGRRQVVADLKSAFHVTSGQIADLRKRGLGYGEIKIALSMAQQLPGGVTDENVNRVLALRSSDGGHGWGQVARQLNLKVGEVVGHVKSRDEAPGSPSHAKFLPPARADEPPSLMSNKDRANAIHRGRGKR